MSVNKRRNFVPHEGARRGAEGVIVSLQPDYCRVGDKVVAFTLHAYLSDAINTAKKYNMTGRPAVHKGTIIPHCYGAEMSDGGGIHSGTVNGACWPLTWSETVYIEGEPVVRDGDLWAMNNGNTIGRLRFPAPLLADEEDNEGADAEKARYVDIEPPDGLPNEQSSQYDFDSDAPLIEGADYARAAPAMRHAPRLNSGRGGAFSPPNIARRVARPPDPLTDPNGYRRYWHEIPNRSESGLVYRPYPRRYWPNMLGNQPETSFHNPFIGQRQSTGMPRPWSNVVAHHDGQFDFGQGRIISEAEFSQLYFIHSFGNSQAWLDYNRQLQTTLQQRNPNLELPFTLSDDIEVETEGGLSANQPDPRQQLPVTMQALVNSLTRVGDNNVEVTGRHRYCRVLPMCFAPEAELMPSQEPQLSEFKGEYLRQLSLQEQYMNRMKPQEVLGNMWSYDAAGGWMRSAASSAQRQVRKVYANILEIRYENSGYSDDAAAKAAAEMKRLAVLHNPDMAAGGRIFSILDPSIPIEDKIGWSSVNSSIGGQWPSRRNLLRQHLMEQSLNNCESPQVQLRNCQSVKGQPGVPMHKQP